MRAVSRERAALAPQRHAAETELGRAADGRGTCARCGRYTEVHGHERRGRAQGQSSAEPDCLLCDFCNCWAEDFPKLAAWNGWKVSGKHPHDYDLAENEAVRLDGSIHTFGVMV